MRGSCARVATPASTVGRELAFARKWKSTTEPTCRPRSADLPSVALAAEFPGKSRRFWNSMNSQIVTRRNLEADLQAIETRLTAEPGSIDLRAERARLLFELGQIEQAKQQYLEILNRDRRHYSTLNNFGVLLQKTGATLAASKAYQAAIALEPDNPIGHTNFGDLLVQEGDLTQARAHYERALRIDPGHRNAHRGLAVVCWALGDSENARQHQSRQYADRPVETLPFLGTGEPVPLVVLTSAEVGNLPWPALVDNRVFSTTTVAVEYFEADRELPPHRLILNAIGDADVCGPALERAQALVCRTGAPVINSPAAVLATGRISNAERLGRLPGVVTPRVVTLPRATLTGPDGAAAVNQQDIAFPLLLRSAGFHMGQHFVRLDGPDGLAAAAAALPGEELLVIEYLDARGPDCKARKYRAMSIGGRLYPLHLAISQDWKIHYFSAAMADHSEHQQEEAAFLADMPGVLGPRALCALEEIAKTLGLDYAGIDFGLSPKGDILLFEANATMRIHPPGPEPQWDYRRASVNRALEAAHQLLSDRASSLAGARRAG
jgi:tetratricopeptide (TPR) repeat protein